ncbi:hypothetical protein AUJ67_05555 [Candidatus Desantisbacteria bacterium CG1_02_49_89]|nr:MAG: hypothetical protein AUJ67_05555 [Candidatus Desantisbacteria bacterium CG1_02_49_89]
MRGTFIRTLEKMAKADKNIFLLTADLGYKLFDNFRDNYPDRFVNVGVAESNMIGVAAGLALSGKNVYCYSMVPFLTMRTFEQIRVDLCYHNLGVKLVGVGGGLVYGLEGMTHQAIEDISIMRSLPNMTVTAPGDPAEVECLIEESVRYKGPLYIRLGKDRDPVVHETAPDFKIGRGIVLKRGKKAVLFAAGNVLPAAKAAVEALEENGLSITLVSMHTIKPIDKKLVIECARRTKAVFTVEEHSLIGGLGSAVAEIIAESGEKVIFRRIALPDAYSKYMGSSGYLRKKYGLTPQAIANRITKELKKK